MVDVLLFLMGWLEKRVIISFGSIKTGQDVLWFREVGQKGSMGYTTSRGILDALRDYGGRGFDRAYELELTPPKVSKPPV
ncbi:MAG: hypothetical protein ABIB47_06510 [Candidatus Woesearchaeota archaeon]